MSTLFSCQVTPCLHPLVSQCSLSMLWIYFRLSPIRFSAVCYYNLREQYVNIVTFRKFNRDSQSDVTDIQGILWNPWLERSRNNLNEVIHNAFFCPPVRPSLIRLFRRSLARSFVHPFVPCSFVRSFVRLSIHPFLLCSFFVRSFFHSIFLVDFTRRYASQLRKARDFVDVCTDYRTLLRLKITEGTIFFFSFPCLMQTWKHCGRLSADI